MEKLIFLFPRKDGLTREEFFAHYLDVHAPLGLELTRTMTHYTVNLRDRGDGAAEGVDAITETWTESVADFMNPNTSFATPEDAQRLFADHDSFIGAPYDAYAVDEQVRKGPERLSPGNGVSPGGKAVVAATGGAALELLGGLLDHDEVTRYVENRVAAALMTGAFEPVHAFVEVHLATDGALAPEIEELVGRGGAVYRVSEYVKK
ncbi:MAG: EthD domain-containing protein [Acidimicrobiia bacterium]